LARELGLPVTRFGKRLGLEYAQYARYQ
jgi:hypothetical protein